jgi:hypothetical protein
VPETELLAGRTDVGKFAPGNHAGGGRKKGVRNAISTRMLDELDHRLAKLGPDANPLLCLLKIMLDENQKTGVRVMAADKILRAVIPQKLEVSNESGARVRIDKMLVSLNRMFPGDAQAQIEAAQPKQISAPREAEVIDVTAT